MNANLSFIAHEYILNVPFVLCDSGGKQLRYKEYPTTRFLKSHFDLRHM